jgi:hypothetical protein
MPKFGTLTISAASGVTCAACSLATIFLLSPCQADNVQLFFEEHLREPLFIGLLTVAAFLFSLQTFIVVTMKENVYGTKAYEKEWREALSVTPGIKRYAALERFSSLLFLAVLVSLIAAVLQFTLGLVQRPYAAVLSVAVALWSILLIFVSLFLLQKNLKSWFEFLAKDEPPNPPPDVRLR